MAGLSKRQGHLAQDPPGRSAQRARCIFQARIDALPGCRDRADDDREVIKHVRQQDGGQRVLDGNGRLRQAENAASIAGYNQPRGPIRALKPAATTTVGRMKGRVVATRKKSLPLN